MEKQTLLFLILVIVCVSVFGNLLSNNKQCHSVTITQDQLTAHNAKAIVITCMDFRLIDDAVRYLDNNGYNNNYDEFILAGASLGYNQKTFTAWAETLDKHIELAEQLHHIKEVIVIDHMNCGAYKIFYNKKSLSEAEELQLHKENFTKFKETVNKKYPHLKVKTLLMKLDGSVMNF